MSTRLDYKSLCLSINLSKCNTLLMSLSPNNKKILKNFKAITIQIQSKQVIYGDPIN